MVSRSNAMYVKLKPITWCLRRAKQPHAPSRSFLDLSVRPCSSPVLSFLPAHAPSTRAASVWTSTGLRLPLIISAYGFTSVEQPTACLHCFWKTLRRTCHASVEPQVKQQTFVRVTGAPQQTFVRHAHVYHCITV